MNEPVVFGPAFEGLVRALGPHLDAGVLQRFRAIGVDLGVPLHPAYPLSTWVDSLRLASEILAPGAGVDEGTYVVGRRMFEGYNETLIGKALMGMMRVVGPRRSLERMKRNLRTANNYSETTLKELSPCVYELSCSNVTFPHYYRGMFDVALKAAGARDVKIELLSHDASNATFRIAWHQG